MPNSRTNILLATVVFIAFIAMVGFSAYWDAKRTREFIAKRENPALGLATAARLDSAASHYKRVGENLLENGYIKQWIQQGEKDVEALLQFMKKVRDKHGLLDASIVSDKTETYYDTNNRIIKLSPDNWERDGWYYVFRESLRTTSIDSWYNPESDILSLYVNVPIFDSEGTLLGVAGGSIHADEFGKILYTSNLDLSVLYYVFRRDGRLVYATDRSLLTGASKTADDLWDADVMETLRRERENPNGVVLLPRGNERPVLWGTYLHDWDTFLITERTAASIHSSMRREAVESAALGGILAITLFFLTLATIRIAYRRMDTTFRELLLIQKRQKAVLHYQETLIETEERNRSSGATQKRPILAALRTLLSNQTPVDNSTFSLRDTLNDVIIERTPAASRHQVTLHTHIGQEKEKFRRGNEILVGMVLQDLLNGLIYSCPPGTDVLLSVYHQDTSSYLDIAVPVDIESPSSETYSTAHCIIESFGGSLTIVESGRNGSVIQLKFT